MEINAKQSAALQRILGIGATRVIQVLREMSGKNVEFCMSDVRLTNLTDLGEELPNDAARTVVKLPCRSPSFNGVALLCFSQENLHALTVALEDFTGGLPESDEEREVLVNEIGNIVLNQLIGSISNVLTEQADFLPPENMTATFSEVLATVGIPLDSPAIVSDARFSISGADVAGEALVLFDADSFSVLLDAFARLD